MHCILWLQEPNAIEFQSHSKFKAKSSGTLWTCKQYFHLFIVLLKFLFQSAGLLHIKNIMHFENPLILRLFPQQLIPFILVNKNNSFDAWSFVRCYTQYKFPHGKNLQWNHKGWSRLFCLIKIWTPLYLNHNKGESEGKI